MKVVMIEHFKKVMPPMVVRKVEESREEIICSLFSVEDELMLRIIDNWQHEVVLLCSTGGFYEKILAYENYFATSFFIKITQYFIDNLVQPTEDDPDIIKIELNNPTSIRYRSE